MRYKGYAMARPAQPELPIERTKADHELAERVGDLRDIALIELLHTWVRAVGPRIDAVDEPDLTAPWARGHDRNRCVDPTWSLRNPAETMRGCGDGTQQTNDEN